MTHDVIVLAVIFAWIAAWTGVMVLVADAGKGK